MHHVSFIISPEKDFEGYLKLAEQFPKDVLNDELKKAFPDLIQDEKADSIKKLLLNQFHTQRESIEKQTAEIEKSWLRIEETFYRLSGGLFKHPDPNKQYTAYPSLLSISYGILIP